MGLEQTWRWFGPGDPVTLPEIRQTGAVGIVTALHQIPVGDVWPVEEIKKRKRVIESGGLRWSVVESVPVHDEIKRGDGNFRHHIEAYKDTIRNLGRCGIDTVCYNFMPVLDWSRTDLRVMFEDSSITTRFENRAFASFDLFILKRADAEKEFTPDQVRAAREYFDGLNSEERETLTRTILFGFPGSGEAFTLEGLKSALNRYNGLGDAHLRESLGYFLKEIVPVAEESGVRLAIHPDDPPWPLLGLPRIVSSKSDVEQLLRVVDSPSNGITLCTGSFGALGGNDVVEIAESFSSRIHFAHLRNVRRTAERDFVEDNHLEGDVDMFGVMKALVIEQRRREEQAMIGSRMPMRPDHGHLMLPDQNRPGIYPGYSLFGRMRGLSELRGLELGIRRSLDR